MAPALPNPAAPVTPTVDCEVYIPDASGVQLTNLLADEFSQPLSGVGTGKIRMALNDPQTSLLIEGFQVSWVDLNSGDYLLRGVITAVQHVVVSPQEGGGEYVEATIESMAGLLRRAIVYPQGGIAEVPSGPLAGLRLGQTPNGPQRFLNWATPELDFSSWPYAVDRGEVCGATSALGPPFGKWNKPDGWIDMGARWIWSRALVGTYDPEGRSLFRGVIDVGAGGTLTFDVACDDGFVLWVNGQPIMEYYEPGSVDGWAKTHSVQLNVSAGYCHVGIEAINTVLPQGALNPGGLLFSCYRAPGTFGAGDVEQVLANSNTTWRCLDYPSTYPSFTPGAIIRRLLAEAQSRGATPGGALPGVTANFSDSVDTAGTAWPPAGEIAIKVGNNYVQMLDQLAELWIEWQMPPTGLLGQELDCYVAQDAPLNGYTGDPMDPAGASPLAPGSGSVQPVTLAKGVNVQSLVHVIKGG